MLHRAKIINRHIRRHNDHAAGMLAGGTLDTGTTLGQPFNLGLVIDLSLFFRIFADIAVSGLIRYGCNRAGLKHTAFTEQRFGIFMGTRLVFAGKIQVDIRHFIALKAQKGLKGDIMPVAVHRRSTVRAVFLRQIKAGTDRTVGDKLTVFAVWADIVRRQRIHLGNAGHRRHKRRAHRPPGAYQITMGVGICHQTLRGYIHHGIAVGDDGIQLFFQPFFHQLRHRIAIDLLCLAHRILPQRNIAALDRRRIIPLWDRPDIPVDHIRNFIGVLHHDLHRGFFTQICKFFEHIIGGAQIQRRLIISVCKPLPRH